MARPENGEVWLVDLGLAAKTRPCLLLTDYPADDELALVSVVSHTTSLRGNEWEHVCPKPFLQSGAFHLQQIHSVPVIKLVRKLGRLDSGELAIIRQRLRARLRL